MGVLSPAPRPTRPRCFHRGPRYRARESPRGLRAQVWQQARRAGSGLAGWRRRTAYRTGPSRDPTASCHQPLDLRDNVVLVFIAELIIKRQAQRLLVVVLRHRKAVMAISIGAVKGMIMHGYVMNLADNVPRNEFAHECSARPPRGPEIDTNHVEMVSAI